jgi:hypothetical protein
MQKILLQSSGYQIRKWNCATSLALSARCMHVAKYNINSERFKIQDLDIKINSYRFAVVSVKLGMYIASPDQPNIDNYALERCFFSR